MHVPQLKVSAISFHFPFGDRMDVVEQAIRTARRFCFCFKIPMHVQQIAQTITNLQIRNTHSHSQVRMEENVVLSRSVSQIRMHGAA